MKIKKRPTPEQVMKQRIEKLLRNVSQTKAEIVFDVDCYNGTQSQSQISQ